MSKLRKEMSKEAQQKYEAWHKTLYRPRVQGNYPDTMNPPSAKKNLLREILSHLYQHGSFPRRAAFRVKHEDAWDTLDSLAAQGFLGASTKLPT